MECAEHDPFMTTFTNLDVSDLQGCLLTLPTSVVELELSHSKEVSVLGTENLDILTVRDDTIRTAPCPKLRGLRWYTNTLTDETLPFTIHCRTTLSSMAILVDRVERSFRFPTHLKRPHLNVRHEPVDVPLLTPLPSLRSLSIETHTDQAPIDMSRLTALI